MDFAFQSVDGGFDFVHDGVDLVIDDGLRSALIHSLFRDARAPEDAVARGLLNAGDDPRGHWFSGIEAGTPDGSLLWLLKREKITPDMPYRVAEKLEQACAWMIETTTGPTAAVVAVRALCQKSARRGRIEGTLTLTLSSAPTLRRFELVYDPDRNVYDLQEAH